MNGAELGLTAVCVLPVWLAGPALSQAGCDKTFESTYDMIQEIIFDGHGCSSAGCHAGPTPAGELDLSRGNSYDDLVGVPVASIDDPLLRRVIPGFKQRSLLWLNVASQVFPDRWTAPLRSMPVGGLTPLSLAELELLQHWIEAGAPPDGVVPETVDLFDVCLPPLRPLEAIPLQPPLPDVGIQIRAPRLHVPARSETEVCFASYYDFSDVVPESSLIDTDDGQFLVLRPSASRNDPLTHHQAANVYVGATPIRDPVWGEFTCKHGPRTGEACDPTDMNSCGEIGGCGSAPRNSVACIGYGPPDAGFGGNAQFTIEALRQTSSGEALSLVPVRGIVIWNSHSFNVTDFDGKVDRWINFEYAAAAELASARRVRPIVDTSRISVAGAPAFGLNEVCHHYLLPPGAELTMLSFHTHKRGSRWRTWRGAFRCDGGFNAGTPCSPISDPDLPIVDICGGSLCIARDLPRGGDCNRDSYVSVNEVVRAIRIALDLEPWWACPHSDTDRNQKVTIDELLLAVSSLLKPNLDPEENLLYTAYDYADPLQQLFDPPLVLGGPRTDAARRTLTYCGLYDNGYSNPDAVVRRSQRPSNASDCHPTHCAEGRVGGPCSGFTAQSRDASCDSTSGAGDGWCDACASTFGLSTDDEMFVLIGSYIQPPSR